MHYFSAPSDLHALQGLAPQISEFLSSTPLVPCDRPVD